MLGISFGLAALFLLEERLRGHWQLQRYLARAEKSGEKLSIEALVSHPPAEHLENGVKIDQAGLALKKIDDEKPFLHFTIRTRVNAEGIATLVDADADGPFATMYLFDPTARKTSWDEFHRLLESGAAAANVVEQTATGPFAFVGTPEKMLELGAGPGVNTAISWMRAQFIWHRHQQDRPKVWTDLKTAVTISQAAGGAWTTLGQMTTASGELNGIYDTWLALSMPGWNDSELAAIQQLFQNHHAAGNLRMYLQMTRARVRHRFALARNSETARFALLYQPDPAIFLPGAAYSQTRPSEAARLKVWAKGNLWKLAFSEQDELRVLRQWEPALRETEKLLAERNWQAAHFASPALSISRKDPKPRSLRFGVGEELEATFADVEDMIRHWVKLETNRNLLQAAVALQRYQLRHHDFPERLEALSPEFLPAPPRDWMNGQELHYRRKSPVDFLLYSVGFDGIDDGGNALASDPKKGGNVFEGRDIVWPRLADRPN